jgi:hypothetical protein
VSTSHKFQSYKEYREKQEESHKAWVERQKEREARIARGEKPGPIERDPTAQEEVSLLGLLKFLVYMLLFTALAGKFVTGSFTWEYQSKWVQLKTYWPVSLCHAYLLQLTVSYTAKSTSLVRTAIGRI